MTGWLSLTSRGTSWSWKILEVKEVLPIALTPPESPGFLHICDWGVGDPAEVIL